MYAPPCKCLGRPLRFEPDSCFTCGRFLPGVAGELEPERSRAGLGALLHAVHKTQDRLGIHPRPPAPRHNHRRVVIEPERPHVVTRRDVNARLAHSYGF